MYIYKKNTRKTLTKWKGIQKKSNIQLYMDTATLKYEEK